MFQGKEKIMTQIVKKIEKPSIDFEIEVKVEGQSKIENNMKAILEIAKELNEYYKNNSFIPKGLVLDLEDKDFMKKVDEDKKTAAKEKAAINKLKAGIKEKVKTTLDTFNKPIEEFKNLGKQVETVLTETYETINEEVNLVDNQVKGAMILKASKYFAEKCVLEEIDFVTYEKMKQNITLNLSNKKMLEEIDEYIARIKEDLTLISTQKYQEEILVEYKETLNVSQAIIVVENRQKRIEEEKAKVSIPVEPKVEIEKPKVTVVEELKTMTFKVTGTMMQLKEIKNKLDELGVKYE